MLKGWINGYYLTLIKVDKSQESLPNRRHVEGKQTTSGVDPTQSYKNQDPSVSHPIQTLFSFLRISHSRFLSLSPSLSLSSKPIHTIHTYIPRIEISVSLVAALSSFPLCLPPPDLISFQTQNPNPNSLSLSLYAFSDLYSILNIMCFCACI